MARSSFKCSKCDRTFSMAAHLARHMSASHGAKRRGLARKKKGGRRVKRARRKASKALGRPRGVASRLGLRDMSLDQLIEVIEAARSEARKKLTELKQWAR